MKILDSQDKQFAGVDISPAAQVYQNELIQLLSLRPTGSLTFPPGTYRVCVGWYSHPDLIRFAVLSEVEGAQDGLACIGKFTVPAP